MNSGKERDVSGSSKLNEEKLLSVLGLIWTKRYNKLIEFVQNTKDPEVLESVPFLIGSFGIYLISQKRYREAESIFILMDKLCSSIKAPKEMPFSMGGFLGLASMDSGNWPIKSFLYYISGLKYLDKDIRRSRDYFNLGQEEYKNLHGCNSNLLESLSVACLIRQEVEKLSNLKSIVKVSEKSLILFKSFFKEIFSNAKGGLKNEAEKAFDYFYREAVADDMFENTFYTNNILTMGNFFCLASLAWPIEWRKKWAEGDIFTVVASLENFNLLSWADYILRCLPFIEEVDNIYGSNINVMEGILSEKQAGIIKLLRPPKLVSKKTLSSRFDTLDEKLAGIQELITKRRTRRKSKISKKPAWKDIVQGFYLGTSFGGVTLDKKSIFETIKELKDKFGMYKRRKK